MPKASNLKGGSSKRLTTAQVTNSSRDRDFFEIVLAYGLIIAVIWTPNPLQRLLYWTTFATILVITLLRREDLNSLGLGRRGFASSLSDRRHCFRGCGVYCVGSVPNKYAAFIWPSASLGARLGILHLGGHAAVSTTELLSRALPPPHVEPMAGRVIRSVAVRHRPRPKSRSYDCDLRMGFLLQSSISADRNVYTIGIAHGILGICFAITVPDRFHHHMRVGLGYLHYHQRLSGRAALLAELETR